MVEHARLALVAIDCPDPLALAEFYSAITGWTVRVDPDEEDAPGEWVELVAPAGMKLAFQRAPGHVAPTWPGDDHPQQMHLDLDVPDLDVGEAAVLGLGARKAEHQPGTTFRVYFDPAGHPFCLVLVAGLLLNR